MGTFHMGPREEEAPMMGKPGAVNTLKGAEVETSMPKKEAVKAPLPRPSSNPSCRSATARRCLAR